MFKDFCSLLISLKIPELQLLNILPAYSQLEEFERRLHQRGKLTFQAIFEQPLGNYIFRQYLSVYGNVDHAVFFSDISVYKTLTSEFARLRTSRRIYEHYLAPMTIDHKRDTSVFSPSWKPVTGPRQSKNAIGIGGVWVQVVHNTIYSENDPTPKTGPDLFDNIAAEVSEILKQNFTDFLESDHFRYLIRCKSLELKEVNIKTFEILDSIGYGAFSHVNACLKIDSSMLYAVKVISKRRLIATDTVEAIMAERDFLATVKSNFVLNLNYAVMDASNIYLVLDYMAGGDLKHFVGNHPMSEEVVQFYAAQVILGLSHIHKQQIIYRDMKLENVLLDKEGNCQISDLGLAVRMKRVRGYAGTPGYAAPEVILGSYYDALVDFFSLGVMLYRMLIGRKPFQQSLDKTPGARFARDIDKVVLGQPLEFDDTNISPESRDFLEKLLCKVPSDRLGANGYDEVKNHPFFNTIDFGMVEGGCLPPPIVPHLKNKKKQIIARRERQMPSNAGANVAGANDWMAKTIDEKFQSFTYKSKRAVQKEVVDIFQHFCKEEPDFFMHLLAGKSTQEILFSNTTKKKGGSADSCCTIT